MVPSYLKLMKREKKEERKMLWTKHRRVLVVVLKEEIMKKFYGKETISLNINSWENFKTFNSSYLWAMTTKGFKLTRETSHRINNYIFPCGYTPIQVHCKPCHALVSHVTARVRKELRNISMMGPYFMRLLPTTISIDSMYFGSISHQTTSRRPTYIT